MAFRFVISDPKTRKSFQKEIDAPSIVGLKIGDDFDGSTIGLTGFKLKLTGGSDKEGFPMRPEIPSAARKRVLLTEPPGFHPHREGERKRKLVRGNQVSDSIMQVNCKIVEGEGDVGMILGIGRSEASPDAPTEVGAVAPKEKKEEPKA